MGNILSRFMVGLLCIHQLSAAKRIHVWLPAPGNYYFVKMGTVVLDDAENQEALKTKIQANSALRTSGGAYDVSNIWWFNDATNDLCKVNTGQFGRTYVPLGDEEELVDGQTVYVMDTLWHTTKRAMSRAFWSVAPTSM